MRRIIHSSQSALISDNPSSSDSKESVKALVGGFVFQSGAADLSLSASQIHPHDKQAWLSTCAMICHPWFWCCETARLQIHAPTSQRQDGAGCWARSRCSAGNVVASFCPNANLMLNCSVFSEDPSECDSSQTTICVCLSLQFCSLALERYPPGLSFQINCRASPPTAAGVFQETQLYNKHRMHECVTSSFS